MARIHVIESSKDVGLARRFVEGLQRQDHSVTWDLNFLVPGVPWKRSLEEAVAAADGLVALLTDNCVDSASGVISSQWMAADIGAARATHKFVIPVVVGDGVPFPGLINDLYAVKVSTSDEVDISKAINAINDAIRVHTDASAARTSLGLPPGFQHLASSVGRFHEDGPPDKSVFVMMKFPDRSTMHAQQCALLEEIWNAVVQVLSAYGLAARRADKKEYHDQLWENICVYMLGSQYGIAILEDRVALELNPNVALEYGFMKSLNRKVALFRDMNFKHDRADLTGKLSKAFEIDESGCLKRETLDRAVHDWLLDLGIPPLRRA